MQMESARMYRMDELQLRRGEFTAMQRQEVDAGFLAAPPFPADLLALFRTESGEPGLEIRMTCVVPVKLHGTLGLVMIGIFVLIRVGAYRRLQQSVAAGIWPAAAVHLNRIRHLVVANLLLGTATFVVALLGRAL
jgi:hypothetical protein